MKRSEFIKEFARKGNISQKDARELLNIAEDIVLEQMQTEDGVFPFSGVKFYTMHIKEKESRLPNGTYVHVDEHYIPKVEFGLKFKRTVR